MIKNFHINLINKNFPLYYLSKQIDNLPLIIGKEGGGAKIIDKKQIWFEGYI